MEIRMPQVLADQIYFKPAVADEAAIDAQLIKMDTSLMGRAKAVESKVVSFFAQVGVLLVYVATLSISFWVDFARAPSREEAKDVVQGKLNEECESANAKREVTVRYVSYTALAISTLGLGYLGYSYFSSEAVKPAADAAAKAAAEAVKPVAAAVKPVAAAVKGASDAA